MTARRASLPGAAELFRTTAAPVPEPEEQPAPHPGVGAVPPPRPVVAAEPSLAGEPSTALPRVPRTAVRSTRRVRAVPDRLPTGRERHEEKITVYCSPEELIDLESARLHLRGEHGLAVDRGRIVREAVAVILADLEAKGDASILVRRLRES